MNLTLGSRSRRVVFGLVALGAAAALAGLGTFATFTSSTSSSQVVGSGTVVIALGTPGPANRLTVAANNMAPGDSVQRAFTLSNTGSLSLNAAPVLTTTASPSSLLDTDSTNGLQVVFEKCSTSWVEAGSSPNFSYSCAGTVSTVLASRAVIGSNVTLSNINELIAPSSSASLRLTLSLPQSAGNTFQGLTSTLTYTFSASQA